MTRFTLDALNPRMREQAARALGLQYGEAKIAPIPLATGKPKVNKYHAIKVESTEGKFDSKREYRHWQELKLREAAGEIKDLRRQVRFSLFGPGGIHIAVYTADFVFTRDGKRVVADSKGHKTREWKRTKKLMMACHGIGVIEL